MLRRVKLSSLAIGLILLVGTATAPAQTIAPDYDYQDYDRARIDRYLDVEVWSNHSDGEYYQGDNIVIHFRVNRDAFVAIYSIDTRGRVNLLFPAYPGEDNYVYGGVTYDLPGDQADYDLEVSGPEGFENIQIIASRERFPIPDWYRGPELVADTDDRDGYMDWLNANYFVDYGGQRFAYDRAVIYVNEWEPYYFRPVYYPVYPSWTVWGNVYVDYPWGAAVYVNGIYWGCSPLYIPRIAVGWHTITLYDHWGHCWEHDFHVSHYNTAVFNKTIIHTSPTVVSKYKSVRQSGYLNPVNHGYPDFEARKATMIKSSRGKTVGKIAGVNEVEFEAPTKKYVRGSTSMVKTDRGYETDASTAVFPGDVKNRRGSTSRIQPGSDSRSDGDRSGRYRKSTSSYEPGSSDSRKERSGASRSGSSIGKSSSGGSKSSGKSSSSSSSRRKITGSERPSRGGSDGGAKIDKKSSSGSSGSKSAPAKVTPPKKSSSSSSGQKSGSSSSKKSSGSKEKPKSKKSPRNK